MGVCRGWLDVVLCGVVDGCGLCLMADDGALDVQLCRLLCPCCRRAGVLIVRKDNWCDDIFDRFAAADKA